MLDALLQRRAWDSGDRHALRYEHPAAELAQRFGVSRRTIERWRAGVHVPLECWDRAAAVRRAWETRCRDGLWRGANGRFLPLGSDTGIPLSPTVINACHEC